MGSSLESRVEVTDSSLLRYGSNYSNKYFYRAVPSLLWNRINGGCKKFCCTGPNLQVFFQAIKMFGSTQEASRAQCYKTFYICNLQELVLVPGRIFQNSLTFAGKAGAYPYEEPLRCST